MNPAIPGITRVDGIAQMGRLVDVELCDELLQSRGIFVVHDAVDLEVVLLIDCLDMSDTVEIDDGVHEILRGHIHVLQLEENPLSAELVAISVTGLDAQEQFIERQRPGCGVHEEVVRQVLQSQAQAVMLLIAGLEQIFRSKKHGVDGRAFFLLLRQIRNVEVRIPVDLGFFLRRHYRHRLQEEGRRRKAFLDFLQADGIREPLFEFLLHRLQNIEVMDHVPPAFLRSFFVSFSSPDCKLPASNCLTDFSV